jgi:hypothetical protein
MRHSANMMEDMMEVLLNPGQWVAHPGGFWRWEPNKQRKVLVRRLGPAMYHSFVALGDGTIVHFGGYNGGVVRSRPEPGVGYTRHR